MNRRNFIKLFSWLPLAKLIPAEPKRHISYFKPREIAEHIQRYRVEFMLKTWRRQDFKLKGTVR